VSARSFGNYACLEELTAALGILADPECQLWSGGAANQRFLTGLELGKGEISSLVDGDIVVGRRRV
jgi:hypothetical protein